MAIQIHIDSDNAENALRQMRILLAGLAAPEPREPIKEPGDEPKPVETKRGRGRPLKDAEPARPSQADQPAVPDNTGSEPAAHTPAAEDAASAAGKQVLNPPDEPAAPLTIDDVRKALNDVCASEGVAEGGAPTQAGLAKAGKIVESFGYKKISHIEPKDFAAVIEAADLELGR